MVLNICMHEIPCSVAHRKIQQVSINLRILIMRLSHFFFFRFQFVKNYKNKEIGSPLFVVFLFVCFVLCWHAQVGNIQTKKIHIGDQLNFYIIHTEFAECKQACGS